MDRNLHTPEVGVLDDDGVGGEVLRSAPTTPSPPPYPPPAPDGLSGTEPFPRGNAAGRFHPLPIVCRRGPSVPPQHRFRHTPTHTQVQREGLDPVPKLSGETRGKAGESAGELGGEQAPTWLLKGGRRAISRIRSFPFCALPTGGSQGGRGRSRRTRRPPRRSAWPAEGLQAQRHFPGRPLIPPQIRFGGPQAGDLPDAAATSAPAPEPAPSKLENRLSTP